MIKTEQNNQIKKSIRRLGVQSIYIIDIAIYQLVMSKIHQVHIGIHMRIITAEAKNPHGPLPNVYIFIF